VDDRELSRSRGAAGSGSARFEWSGWSSPELGERDSPPSARIGTAVRRCRDWTVQRRPAQPPRALGVNESVASVEALALSSFAVRSGPGMSAARAGRRPPGPECSSSRWVEGSAHCPVTQRSRPRPHRGHARVVRRRAPADDHPGRNGDDLLDQVGPADFGPPADVDQLNRHHARKYAELCAPTEVLVAMSPPRREGIVPAWT
jgi:hypothetical protein